MRITKSHNFLANVIKPWAKSSSLDIQADQLKIDIRQQCTEGKISPAKLGELDQLNSNTLTC